MWYNRVNAKRGDSVEVFSVGLDFDFCVAVFLFLYLGCALLLFLFSASYNIPSLSSMPSFCFLNCIYIFFYYAFAFFNIVFYVSLFLFNDLSHITKHLFMSLICVVYSYIWSDFLKFKIQQFYFHSDSFLCVFLFMYNSSKPIFIR